MKIGEKNGRKVYDFFLVYFSSSLGYYCCYSFLFVVNVAVALFFFLLVWVFGTQKRRFWFTHRSSFISQSQSLSIVVAVFYVNTIVWITFSFRFIRPLNWIFFIRMMIFQTKIIIIIIIESIGSFQMREETDREMRNKSKPQKRKTRKGTKKDKKLYLHNTPFE